MRELDESERKIIKELIRDPRISDNKINKKTGIPVKTVNRKRKKLEEENILNYMTYVEHGEQGLDLYHSQSLYLIKFAYGITTQSLKDKFPQIMNNQSLKKHTIFSFIGESNGQVVLITLIESGKNSDIVEIFNAELVPTLRNFFGPHTIDEVNAIPIRRLSKMLHNYMPLINMKNGKINENWPDENLFI